MCRVPLRLVCYNSRAAGFGGKRVYYINARISLPDVLLKRSLFVPPPPPLPHIPPDVRRRRPICTRRSSKSKQRSPAVNAHPAAVSSVASIRIRRTRRQLYNTTFDAIVERTELMTDRIVRRFDQFFARPSSIIYVVHAVADVDGTGGIHPLRHVYCSKRSVNGLLSVPG